jgi:ATP-dependent RNA helicase RhlE
LPSGASLIPEKVEIARREVAATVSHAFFPVAMTQRDELLLGLLEKTDYDSLMIFTRTRKEADVIANLLQQQESIGTSVTVMHSDIRQNDRMKALKGFKDGTFKILVATDVACPWN